MKRALLVVILALAACRRPVPTVSPNASGAFPEAKPVIDAPLVDTKSYDAGFQIGYAAGAEAASPRSKVPGKDEVNTLAGEAAGNDPARNKKWRDGWASGYLDAFRNRALHLK